MSQEQSKVELTVKQELFCNEYIKDYNATGAAKRSGYSENSLSAIGWENLRKPEIKQRISELLTERSLSEPETFKSISDIAKASLNDYFVTKQIVRTRKIRLTLSEYIEKRKTELERAEYVHKIALAQGLLGSGKALKAAISDHTALVKSIKYELIALEVELTEDPEAYRIIDSQPELVEVVELDLVRLSQDKEHGRIKSYTMTEFGPRVELYSADAALNTIAKLHGMFEKDNNQKKGIIQVGFANTDDD